MELIKASVILFVVGVIIMTAGASTKGTGIFSKVAIGVGQVVCFIAALLGIAGFFQWMF